MNYKLTTAILRLIEFCYKQKIIFNFSISDVDKNTIEYKNDYPNGENPTVILKIVDSKDKDFYKIINKFRKGLEKGELK